MKNYDEAARYFKEAIKIDPKDPSELVNEISKCEKTAYAIEKKRV